jgi:hypothetical protein
VKIAAGAALLVVALLLFGCTQPSGRLASRGATFNEYTGTYTEEASQTPAEESESDETTPSDVLFSPDGGALVTLPDGSQVKALCPITGLTTGQAVRVAQNKHGSWVVIAKQ